MKTNITKNQAITEVVISEQWESLRIDYNSVCLRVIGQDNYIKLESFSANGNTKFRVRIEVESVDDLTARLDTLPMQQSLPFDEVKKDIETKKDDKWYLSGFDKEKHNPDEW
ncbi:MAG TPA: hypothetical protein VH815_16490 [Acidobacteriota bacterium]